MSLNLSNITITGNMYVGIPQDPDFVIYIKTDNTDSGGTGSSQYRFSGYGVYDIYWGDGTYDLGVSGDQTHTYGSVGSYEIRVKNWSNAGSGIRFTSYYGDRLKLLEIRNWGTTKWTSMAFSFSNCSNMVGAFTDVPDLSSCTSLNYMFAGCSLFNSNLNNWNVGSITSMEYTFSGASIFNQPLDSWNVSSVISMAGMFNQAYAFNQPLNSWNISSVTNVFAMLAVTSFNQPLDNWVFSPSLTSLYGLFAYTPFNQDINNWDVSGITNMNSLFYGTPFNQPLNNWNMSNVTNIGAMFDQAYAFNQDISGWDVSSVTTTFALFRSAYSFSQDLSSWDIRSVTDLSSVFENSGMSTENYSRTLIGWANFVSSTIPGPGGKLADTPASITLGADSRTYNSVNYGGAPYNNAVSARAYLTTGPAGPGAPAWTIIDAGGV